MKRIISVLTVCCLLLAMMPLSAGAQTATDLKKQGGWDIPAQVNPLYADILNQKTVASLQMALTAQVESFTPADLQSENYVSQADAVSQVREHMKARDTTITVYFKTQDADPVNAILTVIDEAFAHTGVPTEGDYLTWQYGFWGVPDYGYTPSADGYHVWVTYALMYYVDAEQEAEMDQAVEALLAELDLDGLTDYEKLCGVYDYITDNITYDYVHLETPDYWLMYTAYAALVHKTAVCQGYANLLYRLLLELGIDNRIVVGDAGGPHAWNIVQMGEQYYYADSTWDATYAQAGWDYEYFLRGSQIFTQDHEPDLEESAFVPEYPISQTDYIPAEEEGPYEPVIPEPDYLEWEWEVLKLTNRERLREGVKPLTTHELLFTAADIRAGEITEEFSHTRPDGSDYSTVMFDVGYYWFDCGENIAAGPWSPEEVVAGWMDSPGHRANILKESFFHMGVGYESFDDAFGHYWVQDFTEGWFCNYSRMELNLEAVEVEPGTALEDMPLWITVTCDDCGKCYLPILAEYCTGYDPDTSGTQTVTVSCLGLTDTLEITVRGSAVEYADANGDGAVNILDAALLRQYLAGWDVSIDPVGGDANGDGTVNILDAALLRQYLAGWDVTLGPQN